LLLLPGSFLLPFPCHPTVHVWCTSLPGHPQPGPPRQRTGTYWSVIDAHFAPDALLKNPLFTVDGAEKACERWQRRRRRSHSVDLQADSSCEHPAGSWPDDVCQGTAHAVPILTRASSSFCQQNNLQVSCHYSCLPTDVAHYCAAHHSQKAAVAAAAVHSYHLFHLFQGAFDDNVQVLDIATHGNTALVKTRHNVLLRPFHLAKHFAPSVLVTLSSRCR